MRGLATMNVRSDAFWVLVLTLVSVAASLVLACATPFVALATLAATIVLPSGEETFGLAVVSRVLATNATALPGLLAAWRLLRAARAVAGVPVSVAPVSRPG